MSAHLFTHVENKTFDALCAAFNQRLHGIGDFDEDTREHLFKVANKPIGSLQVPERPMDDSAWLFGYMESDRYGFVGHCRIWLDNHGRNRLGPNSFRWTYQGHTFHPPAVAYFVAHRGDEDFKSELDLYCQDKVEISHRCHDPCCVEATHLVLEPHGQNTARAPCKGKQAVLRGQWAVIDDSERELMWIKQCERYHKGKPCIY